MYRWWLTVLGAGYSPVMPGTCGSAVVAVVFVAALLSGASGWAVAVLMLAVAVHGAVVTVKYGDRAIAEYGPDPGLVVSDEQCGQAITYLWLWPMAGGTWEVMALAGAGFVLFRAFDIIKPPPVRQLEKVKGAWGVLLDDVMAGVYANIALQVVWRLMLTGGESGVIG